MGLLTDLRAWFTSRSAARLALLLALSGPISGTLLIGLGRFLAVPEVIWTGWAWLVLAGITAAAGIATIATQQPRRCA